MSLREAEIETGASERERAKISKPMVMLSSSMSVCAGFAEPGPHGTGSRRMEKERV